MSESKEGRPGLRQTLLGRGAASPTMTATPPQPKEPSLFRRAKAHLKEWSGSKSKSQVSLPESSINHGPSHSSPNLLEPLPAPSATDRTPGRVSSGIVGDATTSPVVDPTPAPPKKDKKERSTLKETVKATGSFTKLLLTRIPEFVEFNPVKLAFGIAQLIIEISDQVGDNVDARERRIVSIASQLLAIEQELAGWESKDDMKPKLRLFAKALEKELALLETLRAQSVIKQVAVVEENQTILADVFERINEARIQLQLLVGLKTFKKLDTLGQGVKVLLLDRLKPSHIANHNYHPEGQKQQILRRVVCAPGTRIRQQAEIVRWANDHGSEQLYWLFGPAGSGKSTIAYTIARRFETGLDTGDDVVLGASFFCSRQFEEAKHEKSIIRTLVYQLAGKCAAFADALAQSNQFDSIHSDVRSQINSLLADPWQDSKPMRDADPTSPVHYLLVIDALDEIEGDGGTLFLLALLDAIQDGRLQGLKFFATSRPDPRVVAHIESFHDRRVCRLHDVPVEEARADVKTYLEFSLPLLADTDALRRLAELAEGLFIVVATVTKYLANYSRLEQLRLLDRLLKGLSNPDAAMPKAKGNTLFLDELYRQILEEAFSSLEEDIQNERIFILHSLLTTAEPISVATVAALLLRSSGSPQTETPFDGETVQMVVDSLYSVLYTHNGVVFSYHKSFPDFIFNKSRSGSFWCDEASINQRLATACLHTNALGLKFNIADIPSSFVLDCDNPTLGAIVETNIPPPLSYACRNWVNHLVKSPSSSAGSFSPLLSEFIQLRVLFWVEAMNLLGLSYMCEEFLDRVRVWFGDHAIESGLAADLGEAGAFSTHFSATPASHSTPHLYISALATWPSDTKLSQAWRRHFPRIPSFTNPPIATPLLHSIPTGTDILAFCLSKDEQYAFIASRQEAIRVWDLAKNQWSRDLIGHTDWVRALALSQDGRYLVSGSDDETVRVWNAFDGTVIRVFEGHEDWIRSVAFLNGNGSCVVSSGDDSMVRIWNVADGVEVAVLEHWDSSNMEVAALAEGRTPAEVTSTVSQDGSLVVSVNKELVCLWSGVSGEKLDEHPMDRPGVEWTVAAISGDGSRYAVGCSDGSIRQWVYTPGSTQHPQLHGGPAGFEEENVPSVTALCFVTPHLLLAGFADARICPFTTTNKPVGSFRVHDIDQSEAIVAISLAHNGRRIVTAPEDGRICVWDVLACQGSAGQGEELSGHTTQIECLVASKDGTSVLSSAEDGSVRVWEVSSGKEVAELVAPDALEKEKRAVCCALSHDASIAILGDQNGELQVWQVGTRDVVSELVGHSSYIVAIATSGDGKWIISASVDGEIRVWDGKTMAEVANWDYDDVASVTISDGDQVLTAVSDGGRVQRWRMGTWDELESRESVDFSPVDPLLLSLNGLRIAGVVEPESEGERGFVRVWDTTTGHPLADLRGHAHDIQSVALSHDGTKVASSSDTHMVRVYDVSTGKQLRAFSTGSSDVYSLAFLPSGDHLVAGGDNGTIQLWRLTPPLYSRQRLDHKLDPDDKYYSSGESLFVAPSDRLAMSISTFNSFYDKKDFADNFMTGWIISPEDDNILLYAPLHTRVPHPSLVRTFPPTSTAIIDFSNAALGTSWASCYIDVL